MFFQKAPQIWNEGSDQQRLRYVAKVLAAQGWPPPELIAEATRAEGPLGWLGGQGDPFLAVIAVKPGSQRPGPEGHGTVCRTDAP